MKPPAYSGEPADYVSLSHHQCPQCAGSLIRTPRRPIDHFWSLFVPVHRYRCNRFACQWSGNIRVDNSTASAVTVTPR